MKDVLCNEDPPTTNQRHDLFSFRLWRSPLAQAATVVFLALLRPHGFTRRLFSSSGLATNGQPKKTMRLNPHRNEHG